MRTIEEQLTEIKKREKTLREKKNRRQTTLLSCATFLFGICFLSAAAVLLKTDGPSSSPGIRMEGVYGMVLIQNEAAGVVVLAALAILFCACAAGLLIHIRKGKEERKAHEK